MSRWTRTDDAAARVEFVSHTITEARWPMVVRGIVMLVLGVPLVSWLVWAAGRVVFSGPWWVLGAVAVGSVVVGAGTVLVLNKLSPHDTPTTPLGYHTETFRREIKTPRPRTGEVTRQPVIPVAVGRPDCAHDAWTSPKECPNSANYR